MTSLETKCIQRYFKRISAGGRGPLARAVDYAALRLLILAGAYLFFRQRIEGIFYAALLAVLTLLLAMVLMRIVREIRLERHTQKELYRIRRLLLARALTLMDRKTLLELARPLSPDRPPALLLSVEPASADALLPLARKKSAAAILAPAGFSPAAERFADTAGLRLLSQAALLDAAADKGLAPGDADACAYILAEEKKRHEKRKKLGGLPFMRGCAKKYLATALVLFGLSFLSRYTLYYRLLATLCMSIFSVNFLMDRTRTPRADIE